MKFELINNGHDCRVLCFITILTSLCINKFKLLFVTMTQYNYHFFSLTNFKKMEVSN